MLWEKFVALFKNDSKTNTNNKKTSKTGTPKQPKNVDPSHIGDLGEYKIEVQLRQLPKENRYLNNFYVVNPKSRTGYSQIDHVLITPYALFVIETKNWYGRIKGKRNEKNWSINGRFQKPNPLRQNYGHVKALEGVLREYTDLRYVSVISFTKRCELYIDLDLREIESDEIVIYDIKFTDVIERKLRMFKRELPTPPLTETDVNRIFELLNSNNITDPKLRAEHNDRASGNKVRRTDTNVQDDKGTH